MDLSNLATQENSDTGVWTPVVLYGKQQDFDLKILGDDSDAVQKYARESLKKVKLSSKILKDNSELDDETIDEILESKNEAIVVRIAGIRGWNIKREKGKEVSREPELVTLNGVELTSDAKSYKLLIEKIPDIKDFVLKTSRDRTNFLSKPSVN